MGGHRRLRELVRLWCRDELLGRLGEAAARNVRRFEKAAIVAQWDALIREAVTSRAPAKTLRGPDPAPAPFE
ncbi:MAG: hypothetical protein ACREJ5_20555 [Geminicoccaceae bacterium]